MSNNGSTVGHGVFYGSTPRLYHSTDQVKLVQWSGASCLVSEQVRGLLHFSPCELLLLEAGS
jgi:hypothetical protein